MCRVCTASSFRLYTPIPDLGGNEETNRRLARFCCENHLDLKSLAPDCSAKALRQHQETDIGRLLSVSSSQSCTTAWSILRSYILLGSHYCLVQGVSQTFHQCLRTRQLEDGNIKRKNQNHKQTQKTLPPSHAAHLILTEELWRNLGSRQRFKKITHGVGTEAFKFTKCTIELKSFHAREVRQMSLIKPKRAS